jgi:fatty-acyl-CoA synthase
MPPNKDNRGRHGSTQCKPQRSYTRGSQDKALLAMTIGQAFDNTVAQYPDGEALVVRHQQLRYTWRQLADAVDLHARALLALGLQAGDRLGIWAPNCAQWCITQFASAKIGVILVNINPAYRSSELEYVLKQSGCQWLVCAGRSRPQLPRHVARLGAGTGRAIHRRTAQRAPAGVARVISLDAQPPSGFLPGRNWRSGRQCLAEQLRERRTACTSTSR